MLFLLLLLLFVKRVPTLLLCFLCETEGALTLLLLWTFLPTDMYIFVYTLVQREPPSIVLFAFLLLCVCVFHC
jgi:hypothetical protein